MSTQMEDRLRAALHAGAELITDDAGAEPQLRLRSDAGVDQPHPRPSSGRPRRPGRTLLWSLAAAAVVIAVAALAVGLRSGSSPTRPAHRSTGTPTEPAPAPIGDGLHPATCSAPLPTSWQHAVTAGLVPGPGYPPPAATGLTAVGVDGAGDVIATRPAAQPVAAFLVRPDRTQRPIYQAPSSIPGQGPARLSNLVPTDGDWAVFTLIAGGGQGSPDGIVAVNVKTGAKRVVRSTGLGTLLVVQPPVIDAGTVYWTELGSDGTGHVYAYDLAAGRQRTLDSGQVSATVVAGGGVYWTKDGRLVTHQRGQLPAGFTVQPMKGYGALVSDGRRQAWAQQLGQRFELRMRVGSAAPVTMVRLGTDAVPTGLALAGNLLVWTDGARLAFLDTRTGATAHAGQWSDALAGGGTLAIDYSTPHSGPQVSVLDASTLPDLRC